MDEEKDRRIGPSIEDLQSRVTALEAEVAKFKEAILVLLPEEPKPMGHRTVLNVYNLSKVWRIIFGN